MLFLGHIVADKILLMNNQKTNKQENKFWKNQSNKQTDRQRTKKEINKKIAKENQDEINKNKGETQTKVEDISILLLTFPSWAISTPK